MSDSAVEAETSLNAPAPTVSPNATTFALPSHIPVLDGIRGLAILMVLIYHIVSFPSGHAYSSILQGITEAGWIGVDLFFVLSGFLITGILLDARGQSHYFRNFYTRRALRVFPLYYGYLLCYYVFVVKLQWIHFGADRIASAASELPWLWFYGTNILIALHGNFITASLNHFWSLAVEEHFYLFWPALVLIFDRKKLLLVCPIIVTFAVAVRCGFLAAHASSYAITVLTPCRIDSFAIGGFVAIALREFRGIAPLVPVSRIIFGCSFVVLAVIICWQHGLIASPEIQSVGYTILALLFGGLMVLSIAAKPSSPLSLVFSSSIMRFLGKYSYALYVFHWPVTIAINRIMPQERLIAWCHSEWLGMLIHIVVAGGISVLIAFASWHLYEKHFLKLKRFFEYKKVVAS